MVFFGPKMAAINDKSSFDLRETGLTERRGSLTSGWNLGNNNSNIL